VNDRERSRFTGLLAPETEAKVAALPVICIENQIDPPSIQTTLATMPIRFHPLRRVVAVADSLGSKWKNRTRELKDGEPVVAGPAPQGDCEHARNRKGGSFFGMRCGSQCR
jgi:hypothetical protein